MKASSLRTLLPSPWDARTPAFEDEEIAGFDDDMLEEAQVLLWRGYAPERYVRHDLDAYLGGHWRRHFSPKEMEAARLELAEQYRAMRRREVERPPEPPPPGFERYQCARCNRWLISPIDTAAADAAYLETFGETASLEDKIPLCPPCFEVAMQGGWNP